MTSFNNRKGRGREPPVSAMAKATKASLGAWIAQVEETIAVLEEQEPASEAAEQKRDDRLVIWEELLSCLETAKDALETLA